MYTSEIQISTPEQVLAAMFKIVVSNLEIYIESEDALNALPPSFIDDILAAYHLSYQRILNLSLLETATSEPLTLDQFPSAKIIITRDKEIFKTFYHSPARFDMLPNWVRSYVNFRKNLFVIYLPNEEVVPKEFEINEGMHEFNHITLANILDVPTSVFLTQWTSWLREYIAVSINQKQVDGWLTAECKKEGIEIPALDGIHQRSIFAFDRRPPIENIGYQYCVIIGDELGTAIKYAKYPDIAHIMPAQYAIFALTQEAYHTDKQFLELVAELGIDMQVVENAARLRHGLPAIETADGTVST